MAAGENCDTMSGIGKHRRRVADVGGNSFWNWETFTGDQKEFHGDVDWNVRSPLGKAGATYPRK